MTDVNHYDNMLCSLCIRHVRMNLGVKRIQQYSLLALTSLFRTISEYRLEHNLQMELLPVQGSNQILHTYLNRTLSPTE